MKGRHAQQESPFACVLKADKRLGTITLTRGLHHDALAPGVMTDMIADLEPEQLRAGTG